jgi:hypothetical protein
MIKAIQLIAVFAILLHEAIFNGTASAQDSQLLPVIENNKTIRSFDVLMLKDSFDDISPEDYDKATVISRIKIDWDKQRFLCLTKVKRESLIVPPNKPEPEVVVSQFQTGTMCNGEQRCFASRIGQRQVYNTKVELYKVLGYGSIPDIRMVGLTFFPRSIAEPSDLLSFETTVAFESQRKFKESRLEPGVTTLISSQKNLMYPHFEYLLEMEIDDQTLMPQHIALRETNTKMRVSRNKQWEAIKWKEFDGVFVPTEILSDELKVALPNPYRNMPVEEQTRRTPEMIEKKVKAIPYARELSVKFHWFSVNKPINEEEFQSDPLESMIEFEKLVDPRLCGANELIR